MPPTEREQVRALLAWFRRAARPLPWRPRTLDAPRDPYLVLVSEVMLQQTQAARVAERLPAFLARFPDLASLAAATEHDALALWSGLGYYRRARNLHAAAREIASRHRATIPPDPATLATLPGIGDYTAAAVASLAHRVPAPAVDGNVARVVIRLNGLDLAAASPLARAAARERIAGWMAALPRTAHPGLVNEALIELGATVCTPRAPRCHACPLRTSCTAARTATQHDLPRPAAPAARTPLYCDALLALDRRGRLLVEPRPARGLWAALWQAPTREHNARRATARSLRAWLALDLPLTRADRFTHATTHRAAEFTVWNAGTLGAPEARALANARPGSQWLTRTAAARLPLSTPQRRILLESRS
ncbi:MAG: A/G-specific adenine glycosylase [Phycisphaerales bacterium]|nr:A/G-specific adenine glycosylase [Phycisphaerales bacterium]